MRPDPVPDLDWPPDRARELGERVLDLWVEYLAGLRDGSVARGRRQAEVAQAVALEIPEEPLPLDELFAHLRDVIADSVGLGHPGFLAYISGAGTVPGAAADLIAAALNQNVGGWLLSPAASEIELQLTGWLAARFGLPDGAGGLVVSGGAIANFVALKAARDAKCGWDVRTEGVGRGARLVLYASEEAHVTIDRAADMLGLGSQAVRKIPTDEHYAMRLDLLEAAIRDDLEDGTLPFAVVGTAGTTATGAIDPLPELAELCERHGLWLHVDAAYGGAAALAPELRPLLAGIERADSISFDPHKWLYTPQSGSCVLVRDLQLLADSFSAHAAYVQEDKELTGTGLNLGFLGPQFSRGFWALKIWLSLLAHGRAAYARRIAHDAELARYLGRRVEERPDFELATPVNLSICCFRYRPADLPDEYLDLLNERLMSELQLDGRIFPSNAVLRDRYVLRACIVNFRTEAADLDLLLDVAAELGAKLDRELRPVECP